MAETKMWPEGFWDLLLSSSQVSREVFSGQYQTYVPFDAERVRKDLEYDGTKELLAGYRPELGTCPRCHMVLTVTGTCTGWCGE